MSARCRTICHFSVGSLGNSYGWRSAYLFQKEDKELSGLRLASVASVDLYISGRFVEHFASVNRLGFATLQLSDDASIQHVCEHTCVMLMCRHDLARREKDGFDQALFSRHIGKGFRLRDVSFAVWRFALLEACDWNSTNARMNNENTHILLIYKLLIRSRGSEATADVVFEYVDLAPPLLFQPNGRACRCWDLGAL
jgi:hypothetical protein